MAKGCGGTTGRAVPAAVQAVRTLHFGGRVMITRRIYSIDAGLTRSGVTVSRGPDLGRRIRCRQAPFPHSPEARQVPLRPWSNGP